MSNLEKLLSPSHLKNIWLSNRMVMAPLTRSRATAQHIPTPIMAAYYGERATAGLIITEGTSPSANGVGYPRIPGIYNDEQIATWKVATDAVHENGGKIFMQLMHTGRVSHPENMSDEAKILAPSAIAPATTKMYVDGKGDLEIPQPTAMTIKDIATVTAEYVQAAKNAIKAGFDGVEVHSANGYLLDQFINPQSNERTDNYGGSVENRSRLTLEVTKAIIKAIGAEHVGIRLSPNGAMNDVGPFDDQEETYKYIATELEKLGLAYIHLVNHGSMGAPALPESLRAFFRKTFSGTLILSGGYDALSAEKDLNDDLGDLIAFGRPFIANPDLPTRFKEDAELNEPNSDTFYTPGKEGYIDYPRLHKVQS
ncbi:MAG: alkene reductase [Nonlabens sp.]|nr:alkene reductase [Nonlabens sp.]